MRGVRAPGGALAGLVVSACSFGLVDVPLPDPAPAELLVQTSLAPVAGEEDALELRVEAVLDPGVDAAGERRAVDDALLRLGEVEHAPVEYDPMTGRYRWAVVRRVSRPGPLTLRVGHPAVAGLPRPEESRLQVGIRLLPPDTVRLAEGADFLLEVEQPEAPVPILDPFRGSGVEWRIELTSAVTDFRLAASAQRWVRRARIDTWRIPRDALPLRGLVRVTTRERVLPDAPADDPERYLVELRTAIETTFVVVATDAAGAEMAAPSHPR